MRILAEEFALRAVADPDRVAVIDAEGSHSAGAIWSAAQRLSVTIEGLVDREPTILVQADNSWRTLVAAVAVGRLGGFLTVLSSHAAEHEFDLALEDVQPDVVMASAECLQTWQAA